MPRSRWRWALAYGIVGSYLLRDQFEGIDGWTDATYFALIAYSTLGYDYDVAEMYPVGSDARWFVVSMFLIGVTLFITALSVTLGPIVEGRMKGRKLGADQVISPSTLGGRLLASRAVELADALSAPRSSSS